MIRRRLAVLAAALLATPAFAQTALDDAMAKKQITIAIPTDFPPYGFVSTDLKPQGLDIDMANYIAAKLGLKAELVAVTSANRIPYLQTKKADLVISTLGKNPEREKVIDFTAAYSPFFQAVFATKAMAIKGPADLAGKSVSVTRGAIEDMELTKIAPAGADIKRFEDNNATVSAFVSGQVQAIATGASVAGNMMGRNPQLGTEFKFVLKDSPNFIGVAKGEDKLRLKVNEIIAAAKAAGDLDKMAQKWLGRPAGDLPNLWLPVAVAFDFGAVLAQWPLLAQGAAMTVALTAVAAVAGLVLGVACAWARGWGPAWLGAIAAAYVELIRNTPFIVQLFFVFFGLPSLGVKLSPEAASVLAMVINLGAYAGEIVRAGLDATPRGQVEAAMSLALTRVQAFVHVVLPPALSRVWPAMVSQIIIVMLGSAVCGQIATQELSYYANLIQSRNFRAFEAFIVATAVYLVLAIALRHLLRWAGPRFLFGR